jgi:hypothetical protein
MRVDHVDLGNGAAQFHGSIRIELGREGVMCRQRHGGKQHSGRHRHETKFLLHRLSS